MRQTKSKNWTIAVASGKGGTGKTTVATSLARLLLSQRQNPLP